MHRCNHLSITCSPVGFSMLNVVLFMEAHANPHGPKYKEWAARARAARMRTSSKHEHTTDKHSKGTSVSHAPTLRTDQIEARVGHRVTLSTMAGRGVHSRVRHVHDPPQLPANASTSSASGHALATARANANHSSAALTPLLHWIRRLHSGLGEDGPHTLPCNGSGGVAWQLPIFEFGYEVLLQAPRIYRACSRGEVRSLTICRGRYPLYFFVPRQLVRERVCRCKEDWCQATAKDRDHFHSAAHVRKSRE